MLLKDMFGFPLFSIFFAPDDDGGNGDDDADDDDLDDDEEDLDDEDEEEEDDDDLEEEWDSARAMKTIKAQRKSEKALKKELAATNAKLAKFEKEEQKRKDAEKSEIEKAKDKAQKAEDEAAELQAVLREERIHRHIELQAYRMGFMDPEDAYNIVTAKFLDEIEYDDETGDIKGHKKVLEKLAEEKPYLIGSEITRKGTPVRGGKKSKRKKSDFSELTVEEATGINVGL